MSSVSPKLNLEHARELSKTNEDRLSAVSAELKACDEAIVGLDSHSQILNMSENLDAILNDFLELEIIS
uniref:WGS project CBMG000000000 data, contig CS5907-c001999 n=1 Tax=Fusarium acuminatum CS5907 TaxID=1318461 RepID=A0A090M9F1_9HYPO|nr:unnamed protein product [Fusarium acuminatum CS5907]